MNVKTEKVEKNIVQLEVEVGADRFEEAMQKAYLKNAKKFNIPGFRKGKAPRKMIERMYGEGVFYEDAIDLVIEDTYPQAIKNENLHPVDRPELDIKQVGSGKELIYTAKVMVKPEVELGEYKGVEVAKIAYPVFDEDVDKEINNMLEKAARVVEAPDKAVADGDTVVIDFEGFVDGEVFEGGKAEGHSLTIGTGQFIPGFEEQIIGKNIGEEFDVNVTFPADYPSENLATKESVFKVKLHSIKTKEYPELDDEFAKDVSEFDTLEDLKKATRENLEKNAATRTKREQDDAVVKAVVDKAELEIPDVMVERQIDDYIKDAEYRLSMQGMNFESYLQYTGGTIEQFRESMKDRAENEVKTRLVVEKIADVEKFEVDEADIDSEILRVGEQYKMEADKVRELLGENGIENMKQDMIITKTMEYLTGLAKLV